MQFKIKTRFLHPTKLNILKNLHIKSIALVFTFLILVSFTQAQSFADGLHIGIKFGGSQYLGESGSAISGRLQEFDNTFGLAYDLEVSKYLSNHIELGVEIGASTLTGNTDDPQLSAEGFHYTMLFGIDDPVEYENKLLVQKVFVSYYLRDLSNEGSGVHLNPFIRGGIGHIFYKAKFKYQDAEPNDLIFGKGVNDHNNLSSAVFSAGAGLKASVSEQVSLMASAMLNYVRLDFLDVVYNYDTMGKRNDLNGMYTEFKIGLFYNFGSASGGSKKKSKSGNGGKSTHSHLPFARH